MNRYIFVLAALAIGANVFAEDESLDCACQRCGCQSQCRKVCRVVCEMKEVKKTCYSCKCEDFCVPGPSCKVGEVCECNPCGCNSGGCRFLSCIFGDGCTSHRTLWKPSCEATVRTRKKLYKSEVTVKVPTYKWVVEYTCDRCQSQEPCQLAGPGQSAAVDRSDKPSAAAPVSAGLADKINNPNNSNASSGELLSPPAELEMPKTAGNGRAFLVQPAADWSK